MRGATAREIRRSELPPDLRRELKQRRRELAIARNEVIAAARSAHDKTVESAHSTFRRIRDGAWADYEEKNAAAGEAIARRVPA